MYQISFPEAKDKYLGLGNFFFHLVWLSVTEEVCPKVHVLSQHLLGFIFQLKPQMLLWKLMWQLYQKAKQWKRLHWYVTSTFIGTKSKNCIISTCDRHFSLLIIREKKCANQIYCLARGYHMNSYKFLITQPQQITACPKIQSSNLESPLLCSHQQDSVKNTANC